MISPQKIPPATLNRVIEPRRIRFSGPSSELRVHPDLLRSAYLLRGSQDQPPDQPGSVTHAGRS